MQLINLLPLAGAALALPHVARDTPTGTVTTSDIFIRYYSGSLQSISFNITSEGPYSCSLSSPFTLPTGRIACTGDADVPGTLPDWSFNLKEAEGVPYGPYQLELYRSLSAASGRAGTAEVDLVCIKGPVSADDVVCQKTSPTTVELYSEP